MAKELKLVNSRERLGSLKAERDTQSKISISYNEGPTLDQTITLPASLRLDGVKVLASTIRIHGPGESPQRVHWLGTDLTHSNQIDKAIVTIIHRRQYAKADPLYLTWSVRYRAVPYIPQNIQW